MSGSAISILYLVFLGILFLLLIVMTVTLIVSKKKKDDDYDEEDEFFSDLENEPEDDEYEEEESEPSYNAEEDSAFSDSAFAESPLEDSAFSDSAFSDSAFSDSAFSDSAFGDSAFADVPPADTVDEQPVQPVKKVSLPQDTTQKLPQLEVKEEIKKQRQEAKQVKEQDDAVTEDALNIEEEIQTENNNEETYAKVVSSDIFAEAETEAEMVEEAVIEEPETVEEETVEEETVEESEVQTQSKMFAQPVAQMQPKSFAQQVAQEQPERVVQPEEQEQPEAFAQPVEQEQPEAFAQPVEQVQPEAFAQPVEQVQPEAFAQSVEQVQPELFEEPVMQMQQEVPAYTEEEYDDSAFGDSAFSDSAFTDSAFVDTGIPILSDEAIQASVREAEAMGAAVTGMTGSLVDVTAAIAEKEKTAAKTTAKKHGKAHSKQHHYNNVTYANPTDDFFWFNKVDASERPSYKTIEMYYHHFNLPKDCLEDLLIEMYDCGLVRTEEIRYIAYGIEPRAVSIKEILTSGNSNYVKQVKKKEPTTQDLVNIYEKWCGYVDKLFDIIEMHADEATYKQIRHMLYEYGRSDVDELIEGK